MAARPPVPGPASAQPISQAGDHVTPIWQQRVGRDADTAHLTATPPVRKTLSLHHIKETPDLGGGDAARDETADLVILGTPTMHFFCLVFRYSFKMGIINVTFSDQ